MVRRAEIDRYPFFNRELSWLSFNRRVLEQATQREYPLLERLRYLAFVSSNLDEFFEIRVSGLLQQIESGMTRRSPDGLSPLEQYERIRNVVSKLVRDQYRIWREEVVPSLGEERIHFKTWKELTRTESRWVRNYFEERVYPVLTPLGIDPAHPFPQITNKSLNLLVTLRNPDPEKDEDLMAIVPVPRILPRVVRVDLARKTTTTLVFLSDIVSRFAHTLFPGFEVLTTHAFRVTRNSDLYIDEEEVENLLKTIEEELHKMQKGAAVRLEIADTVGESVLQRLLKCINLGAEHVYRIHGPLNLLRLMSVYDMLDRPDLKFPPFVSRVPAQVSEGDDLFESIAQKDILLHHPFDSFSPVVDFIRKAAEDPNVFAVKQTLYRTSGDSPVVEALIEAAKNGKQVTALIELKARFDEANNIQWARQLEEAGVHVVYGLVGYKTHCKCSLVVRREGSGLKRYVHLGTGNYNPKTARLYTDLGYFTARTSITQEVADLFNSLTGFARSAKFRTLLVSPFNLHPKLREFIRREISNARSGKPARIIIKVNSLIDTQTIIDLYQASSAGVKIDLIVRGICGLVPGIRGISENIRVRSILGRYLEHSRIFYFQNHGRRPRIYLGSADWMPRNFFRRIEAAFPVEDVDHRKELMEILRCYLRDSTNTKLLRSNGAYVKVLDRGKKGFSVQEYLMRETERRIEEALEPSGDSTKAMELQTTPPAALANVVQPLKGNQASKEMKPEEEKPATKTGR